MVTEPGANPLWQPARRLAQKEKEIVEKLIKNLVKEGILEPAKSPWATPILLVKKPGINNWRMVGDYRRLNTVLRYDRYPMPAIDEILQALQGRFFTAIDLCQGFHQLPVKKRRSLETSTDHSLWYFPVHSGTVRCAFCTERLSENDADITGSAHIGKPVPGIH